MSDRRVLLFVVLFSILVGSTFIIPSTLQAQSIEELRSKIDDQNKKLKELELDIAIYQSQLTGLGQQKKTLTQTVSTLDVSRKKISTDIKVTENRIQSAELTIEELKLEIEDKERKMQSSSKAIEKALREMREQGEHSFIENFLSETTIAAVWEKTDVLGQFQSALSNRVNELQELRIDLTDKRIESESKKYELVSLKKDKEGQKWSLDAARAEQNRLLAITKNEEINYQKLLKEKQAAKDAFEKELKSYEDQLSFAIDPSKIPPTGKGVLSWPLASVKITQTFGNTAFSTANPQVYNGSGHNGIDLAASRGTKVMSAMQGVVEGTGNTDLQSGCYSYGKWALVRHPNGLSTLYAHLSTINVEAGEGVSAGELIGYSGNTGYSTGPHLHFSVFTTQGVKIMKLGDFRQSKSACGNVSIPVASKDAYLNPLSYL